MEFYEKEPSDISHEVDPEPFDFPDLVRLEVLGGKRIRNMVYYAMKNFGPGKPILWTGQGEETTRVVTCVEIMKNNFKTVYQYTRVSEMKTSEVWHPLPIMEGLDSLRITHSVPIIYILLSLEPLDESALGYQKHVNGQVGKKVVSELAITPADLPMPY